ncbi:MAG TPA: lysoplasmalogenase [Myxococcota bacterium]|nr:lysoplasmalogenase [Myxococcota bacterium]HQK50927.1 lysoplasmalogenase [Myxococcota bacterium]
MWLAGVLGTLGLVLVLFGEVQGILRAQWLGKSMASLAFLAAGTVRWWSGCGDGFGALIWAGLAWSVVGDLCLLSRGTGRVFLAGMVAFLLAHLCYIGAFGVRGLRWDLALWVLPPLVGVGAVILRWLASRLQGVMRLAVPAYLLAVTGMLAAALLAVLPSWEPWTLGTGAVLFFVSDALVARQRFVHPSPWNRVVGLPLYYGAQWLLVFTIS